MEIVDYTPDGEPIYAALPELPDGWDMTEDERWSLYAEWSTGLWFDCRV